MPNERRCSLVALTLFVVNCAIIIITLSVLFRLYSAISLIGFLLLAATSSSWLKQLCKSCSCAAYRVVYGTHEAQLREQLSGSLEILMPKLFADRACRLVGTTENAGLENAGPSYRWVENARPVAMERRWYQCCKTEIDVVVRCRKHTRTGNIVYAVINSYRKKYTLLTQSELKAYAKSECIKSQQKTHHSVKIANEMYPISY